jgi:hypothetical protein
MTRMWAVLAIVSLSAALLAGCGGGGQPQVETSPTPPTGEDAALAPCRALQALQTYRYSVSLKLESPEPEGSPTPVQATPTTTLTREFNGPFLFEYNIDASFVAPDRAELNISGVGSPFTMIVIGDQSWIQLAGEWQQSQQGSTVPYRPVDICEAILADLDLSQSQPEEEEINDVKTLHYTFTQVPSEQGMGRIFGMQSDMGILLKKLDVGLWLSEEDNSPVRIDVSSSGLYADGREMRAHILVDIRDANSTDIQVEPPM